MNRPGGVLENANGPQLSMQVGQPSTGASDVSRSVQTGAYFCHMANGRLETQKIMAIKPFMTRPPR